MAEYTSSFLSGPTFATSLPSTLPFFAFVVEGLVDVLAVSVRVLTDEDDSAAS